MKKKRASKGKLTVVAGPMFSGKTSKLVAMVEVFTRMGHKVLTVKPRIDNRYGGKAEIHSHDNKKTSAVIVDHEHPEEILDKVLQSGVDDVIFDEVQFFHKRRIMKVVEVLRSHGVHVIVAGLLYDYRRKPFGATSDFMGVADERLELLAVCQRCGSLARQLERLKGGKQLIAVGADDMYIAVCDKCHRIFR